MTGPLDFLIIGAEKSGTTWLADMLRQHPQVFIPEAKELFYFNARFFESPELVNFNASQPFSWYLAFFEAAAAGELRGEASPAYLWDEAAPQRIFDFNPVVRLIAVLRNPAERAFSQYLYYIQRGVAARLSFEHFIERRPDALTRGLYARQLERYRALFPPEHLHIAFYDDLRRDNRAFLAAIQDFLRLPHSFPENMDAASNVTGAPRFAIVNRTIAWMRYPLRKYNPPALMRILRASGLARLQERIRLANTRPLAGKPVLTDQTRRQLDAYFRPDILALQELTRRDLSSWLAPEP